MHQQIHDDLLQFSANTSQGPELTSARKKLKRNLFRAVSEGNVEELQRLLAELKERSRACTNLPVPGELCSHLGEGCCCLREMSLFPKPEKYLYFPVNLEVTIPGCSTANRGCLGAQETVNRVE